MYRLPPYLLILLMSLVYANPVIADFDVDDADSLDFEAFHRDKNPDKKTWEKKSITTSTNKAKTDALPLSEKEEHQSSDSNTGREYQVRERYSLERSTETPYSAFYVIEALHKQMASLCPKGWEKIKEWSKPVEKDFYLYYELRCL